MKPSSSLCEIVVWKRASLVFVCVQTSIPECLNRSTVICHMLRGKGDVLSENQWLIVFVAIYYRMVNGSCFPNKCFWPKIRQEIELKKGDIGVEKGEKERKTIGIYHIAFFLAKRISYIRDTDRARGYVKRGKCVRLATRDAWRKM